MASLHDGTERSVFSQSVAAASQPAAKSMRPISPHLAIYQPQLTWVLSIAHRVSGAGLAVGTLHHIIIIIRIFTDGFFIQGFMEVVWRTWLVRFHRQVLWLLLLPARFYWDFPNSC